MSALSLTTNAATTPSSARLRDRRPLLLYAILAYGLTWMILVPLGLALRLGLLPEDAGFLGLFALLAPFGPALAAVAATADGRAGLRRLRRRLLQWRVGAGWYLIVLAGVPLVQLAGAFIVLGRVPLADLGAGWPLIVTRYLPYVLATMLFTSLAEEPGWRGVALPRLQGSLGPLRGTAALAVLWTLWHLPNLLFPGWTAASFALWALATLASTVIYVWVYNHTGGSLLLAMLLHAAINAGGGLVSALLPALDEPDRIRLYLAVAISFGLWAALLIAATRGRLGYQPPSLVPPSGGAGS